MAKFKVISPLLHDGKKYETAHTIELDEAEATPLVKAGAIELLSRAPAKNNKEPET